MTADQARIVTRVAVATALLAGALLVAAFFVPALGTPGLVLLFSVPLARNLVIVVVARGADRWLALLGIAIVAVVVGFTLR